MSRLAYVGAVVLGFAGCAKSDSVVCESATAFERTCPAKQVCDNVHHLCVPTGALAVCKNKNDDTDCTAGDEPGFCRDQVCIGVHCGDGIAVGGELCDGDDFRGRTCADFRFYDAVPLRCTDTCGLDLQACTGRCGDDKLQSDFELCDGMPPDLACTELGYGAGFLDCTNNCGPKIENCQFFGWRAPTLAPRLISDLDGTSDTNMVAVGNSSMAERWDGKTWKLVDLSSCITDLMGTDLEAVSSIADNEAWIVTLGTPGTLLHVTPTMCAKFTMPVGGAHDVIATSNTDVWLATNAGLYRFDGTSFSQKDSVATMAVWASGPSNVYMVTASNGVRHYNGATASAVTMPASPTMDTIKAVWGSGNDVYVGGADSVNDNAVLVHSTDGSTWTPLLANGPIKGHVSRIQRVGARLYIGTTSTNIQGTFVAEYDGSGWQNLEMPNLGGAEVRLAVSPAGTIYAGSAGTKTIHRYDGAIVTTKPARGSIRLAARSPSEAYMASTATQFWGWNGATWSQIDGANVTSATDVAIAPTGEVLVLTSTAGVKKLNGATTVAVDATSAANGYRFWVGAMNDIWIVKTTGGLAHWDGVSTTVCASCNINAVAVWGASKNDVWAVGGNVLSHWDGSKWNAVTPPVASLTFTDVTGWASNDVVAIAGIQGAFHYDGSTWTQVPFSVPNFPFDVVWGTSHKDVFIGNAAGVVLHHDGTRFSPVDLGGQVSIQTIGGAGDAVFFGDSNATVHQLARTKTW